MRLTTEEKLKKLAAIKTMVSGVQSRYRGADKVPDDMMAQTISMAVLRPDRMKLGPDDMIKHLAIYAGVGHAVMVGLENDWHDIVMIEKGEG